MYLVVFHDSKGQNYYHTITQHYSLFYIQLLISHHRHLDSINNLPEITVYKTYYLNYNKWVKSDTKNEQLQQRCLCTGRVEME